MNFHLEFCSKIIVRFYNMMVGHIELIGEPQFAHPCPSLPELLFPTMTSLWNLSDLLRIDMRSTPLTDTFGDKVKSIHLHHHRHTHHHRHRHHRRHHHNRMHHRHRRHRYHYNRHRSFISSLVWDPFDSLLEQSDSQLFA